MSGIVGTYYLDGRPAQRDLLGRMVDVLAHRGPDGSAIRCDGSVGLGHRMLHATPESLHETLPLKSQSGSLVLTSDARIDNRDELMRALGTFKHRERPVTDSELILAAYEKWGRSCPDKLLGDFAFVIWDAGERQLFCARDHFGVKPLYYFHEPGRLLAFASEIKALFELPDVPRDLNEVRVAEHMLMPVEEDPGRTFYKHVRALAPAHTLQVTPLRCESSRYWELNPSRELQLSSDREYSERLRELFTEAVRCRLRSVHPVGAMLSGGLDSSSIACTAAQIMDGNEDVLHTFSAIFDEVPESDERTYINAVTEACGVRSHFFHADNVSPLSALPLLHWHQDRSLDAGNVYINWQLYQKARTKGVRVLLDGFDGDTTLSHGRYRPVELAMERQWVELVKQVKAHAKNLGQPWGSVAWAWIYRYAVKPSMVRHTPLRYLDRAGRKVGEIFRAGDRHLPVTAGKGDWRNVVSADFVSRMEPYREEKSNCETEREHHYQLLSRSLLPKTLEMLDATAAAHSIELRVPFFDKRLVEFCLSLPAEQKMNNGWTRLVMRRAMEGILPSKIQWRPSKSNLGPSFDHGLLKYEKHNMKKMVTGQLGDIDRFVDLSVLQTVFRNYDSGQISGGDALLLWRALSLALWLSDVNDTSNNAKGGDANPDYNHQPQVRAENFRPLANETT